MKQSRSIFLSYIILIISSISLLCIFHLNALEHKKVEIFLKITSAKQKELENLLSDEMFRMCGVGGDNELSEGEVINLLSSTHDIYTESYPTGPYESEGNIFCQKLQILNDRITQAGEDEGRRMQSVKSNLHLLNYLNPILLLIIPLSFAVWRTGNYIHLLIERKKIYIDSLTGAFNRRYLYETINDSKPSHLVMLDLDDFKQINDKYGHLAGDRILIAFTNLLRQTLRNTDEIVRFGGDEFIIMLYNMQLKDARQLLTRLKFMSYQYVQIGKQGRILLPGFSAGLVEYDGELENAIDRADAFVYQEKIINKNNQ